ncbi:hypothetical protein OAF63_05750 [Saprospiraceae bacterium]|nr:hypothetical protein [Saprospiraceae bacterium]
MNTQLYNLQRKVKQYKEVLQNTEDYRQIWDSEFKAFIIKQLEQLLELTGLEAKIEVKSQIAGLEAIVLDLGETKSGIYEVVSKDFHRHLVKNCGGLIYQQLFNGKIIVLIQYPFIENYGEPRPPKTVAIYRPEELTEPFFIRHLEELITEITNWEDFDDDEPNKKIGFKFNFGLNPDMGREPLMSDEKE